jgi:hypothetical protein
MHIKYGELAIIPNEEQSNIFTNILIWLKNEKNPPKNSKYVFLFDDGEIHDNGNIINSNFKMFNSILSVVPMYFEKIKNKNQRNIYFYKNLKNKKDKDSLLKFNQLFNSYSKYNFDINIESDYNSIYYCHKNSYKPEIFGLIRIKSSDNIPRYQFAYDSDEFTKEEIINLIYTIFNPSISQDES